MPLAGSRGIVRIGRRREEPRRGDARHDLELAREPRLDDLLEVARLRPGIEAADDRRVPGQVDQRARPVGGDDLAAADLPVRLAAHARSSTCDAAQVLEEEVHLGLHVAERAVGAELPVVLGLEVRVEHLAKQRLGLLQLVLLVLHGDPGGAVVLEDLAPGVEQVHDPVLHAAQALLPLGFVRERLLAHALEEGVEEPALERRRGRPRSARPPAAASAPARRDAPGPRARRRSPGRARAPRTA